MAFTLEELLEGVRDSRKHFLKHVHGLREEQSDCKPSPACKSIRETLAHLIQVDRAVLQTGQEPDYAALERPERDLNCLRAMLEESHEQFCAFLATRRSAPKCTSPATGRSRAGPFYLSAEDFYHAGQVAFVRMATDPSLADYSSISGGE
jgi:uncharacterized damage-inducible protein DinB